MTKGEIDFIKTINWIEENCLSGIKIASDSQSPKVEVDEYSGSKFKLFTLLDIEETISKEQTEELLYDIGCVAKIGSAGSNEDFSPSVDYYNSLLANKISVFKLNGKQLYHKSLFCHNNF